MSDNVNDLARGRWRQVLVQLGIPERYLSGNHTECPLERGAGRDRFRFTNHNHDGTFYCSVCGPGTPIELLARYHGWTYKQAIREVRNQLQGAAMPDREAMDREREERRQANCQRITQFWGECSQSRDNVVAYLQSRGLSVEPPECLREHPRAPLYDKGGNVLGHYPAMVAPFHDRNGRGASLHRTYIPTDDNPLPPNESRKKVMPPCRPLKGGAIRLFDLDGLDRIAVAEGIETALAVYELWGVPCWALYSADNLEAWYPPEGIVGVSIFADNDKSCTGQRAAYKLAWRLYQKGFDCTADSVHVPPKVGMDWLDYLNAKKNTSVSE